ncbi:MAG: hypothetical protein CML13_12790 [Puniceicoccaceae bacterium]|nr:hypothetical protein [Puniceicoccaceae bacterium]|tara:strand:+ start:7492 stop:10590 length:3099 start_codon:yes stop_codon:yes gene_type:complete
MLDSVIYLTENKTVRASITLFYILLLVTPAWLKAEPVAVKALETIPCSQTIRTATALYNDGRGNPTDFETAFELFESAADQGDPVAQYYTGHMYLNARGTFLDTKAAWRYFKLAADQGVDRAYGRLSYMLTRGLSVAQDWPRAIHYLRIAAQSDVQSMNNLANYIIAGKTAGTEVEALDLLKKAVAANNLNALNNLGYYHTSGTLSQPDPEYGIQLLLRAVELGDTRALDNLWRLRRGRSQLVKKEHAAIQNLPSATKHSEKEAYKWIREPVAVYRQAGIEAGLDRLEDTLNVWLRSNRLYPFRRQVWWEAQALSGREDPEWSYRLYQWLYQKCKADYLRRNPNKVYLDSAMLHNLSKEQLATGRIAGMAQTSEWVYQGFLANERIDLNLQPAEAMQLGQPKLPRTWQLQTVVHMQPGSHNSKKKIGTPLFYGDIFGLIVLPRADLYQGAWRGTLGYTQWIRDWVDAVLRHGIENAVSRPNEVWQAQADAAFLDAQVYEWLGFYNKALQQYAIPIDSNQSGYASRHLHEARTRKVRLELNSHQSPSENLESLQTLRQLRKDNKFDTTRAPLEVDLAIASLLRHEGQHQAAREKLDDVLSAATSERLFLARIDALRQRAIWGLADQDTTQVEDDLIQLLQLSRSKGLKINEPELYHLYARLKASQGDIAAAIDLQHTSIEFCESIDLYAWLPLRYLELAEWYQQIGNDALVEHYLQLARKLINQPGAEYPQWIRKATKDRLQQNSSTNNTAKTPNADTRQPHKPPQTASSSGAKTSVQAIDLQPVKLVSVPIKGKPALGLFTLTNSSANTQSLQLTAAGHIQHFQATSQGDYQLSLNLNKDFTLRSLDIELQGNTQYLIYVDAPAGQEPLDLTLTTTPDEGQTQQATFQFHESGDANENAVINAAYLEGNPFYMVSVFHLLQRSEQSSATSLDLRIRASSPARIEAYSGDGELIFIDADGDGTFTSPGDILRSDTDSDGHPNVPFLTDSDSSSLELMILPESLPVNGMLDIHIESQSDQGWRSDSVDTIHYHE